jgi:hypothetical protein
VSYGEVQTLKDNNMATKKNNERTGLTVPKPRADKTSKGLSQTEKKDLDGKRITANVAHGHGKSKLRPEEIYHGPQGQEVDTGRKRDNDC